MTGTDPNLRMANDIAAQFRHLPHGQAVEAVAAHLRSFWDPRMRRALVQRVASASGEEPIDPIVAEAAGALGP